MKGSLYPKRGGCDPQRTAALGTLRVVVHLSIPPPPPPASQVSKSTKVKVVPHSHYGHAMKVLNTLKVPQTAPGWSMTIECCYASTWPRAWGLDCSNLCSSSLWCPLSFPGPGLSPSLPPSFPLMVTLLLSLLTFVSFQNSTTLWLPPSLIRIPLGLLQPVLLYRKEGYSTFKWCNKDLEFIIRGPSVDFCSSVSSVAHPPHHQHQSHVTTIWSCVKLKKHEVVRQTRRREHGKSQKEGLGSGYDQIRCTRAWNVQRMYFKYIFLPSKAVFCLRVLHACL